MSLYQRNSSLEPQGIDVYIQSLQSDLYGYLKTTWGLTDTTFNSYGRCYRKPDNLDGKQGYIPAWYPNPTANPGSNSDYTELIAFNDNVIMQSFFDVRDTVKANQDLVNAAKVDLIVMVNLSKLETLLTGNPAVSYIDEVLLSVIQGYIGSQGGQFILREIYRGAKKAFADYSGSKKNNSLVRDLSPFYACSFCMDLPVYNFQQNNCS